MKNKGSTAEVKIIARNRRARHDYHIETTIEAGLVLKGTEVKSLRQGHADIADAYATVRDGEIFLIGMHIAAYDKAGHFNHQPRQPRKLLLHKANLRRLAIKINERGYTLIPLEIYFRKGWAKVLLGLARGRKQYDNRASILRDEGRREMREAAQSRKNSNSPRH